MGSPISRPGVKGQIVFFSASAPSCPTVTSYLNLDFQTTRSHPVFRSLALFDKSRQSPIRIKRHTDAAGVHPGAVGAPEISRYRRGSIKLRCLMRAQILWLPKDQPIIGTNPMVADAAGDLRNLRTSGSKASQ